jgi:hypothetical protein
MPTPSSGPISMNDVYLETNLTRSMDNFFDVAAVGGGGGGMYHNLAMGPSNNQDFATMIYSPYNAGANLPLSNWYNYSQDEPVKITFEFNNTNTQNDIDISLQLYDPNSATHTAFYSNIVAANGGFIFEADYNTNQNPSSYGAGLYRISINVSAMYVGGGRPPGTGVNGNTTSASDTDGVGAGTVRAANNISNFNSLSPLTNFFLVNGNISGTGIYINKRTSIDVVFN